MTQSPHSAELEITEKLPLAGKRLHLTAFSSQDIHDLLPFFQDISVLRYYLPTTVRPMNEPQLRLMLQEWDDGDTNYVFALRHENKICGLVNLDGLDLANGHAEIGVAITNQLLRGQGLAEEGLRLLIEFAFGELNLNRIWCRIIRGNEPSVKLFSKVGFTQEGVLRRHVRRSGEFRDMLIFGLLRDEYHTNDTRTV
ncbi:MAG: GNAT family protein [Eubacteriales bacterium]|nr:GNAT family protein [Eubacteriales bacterium]